MARTVGELPVEVLDVGDDFGEDAVRVLPQARELGQRRVHVLFDSQTRVHLAGFRAANTDDKRPLQRTRQHWLVRDPPPTNRRPQTPLLFFIFKSTLLF